MANHIYKETIQLDHLKIDFIIISYNKFRIRISVLLLYQVQLIITRDMKFYVFS